MRAGLRLVASATAIAAAIFAGAARRAEAGPDDGFRWIRGVDTPERALRQVCSAATARGCDAVLFVFDLMTFAPPPGKHEFVEGLVYRDDLPDWFEGLAGTARVTDLPLYAATSQSRRAVRVGDRWADDLRPQLDVPWWRERRFQSFSPGDRWVRRLAGPLPAKRPAIVLLASEMPPEVRASGDPGNAFQMRWRRKLLDRDTAFEPERVAANVRALGGVFFAIAPEVAFGDFLPVQDLPQFPWVARPQVTFELDFPRRTGPGVDWGGRFAGWTPMFQTSMTELNTRCPSGYGHWPYARAAAETGGLYVFYPFRLRPWADDCPRFDPLVDALAPELVPAHELRAKLRRDPLVAALARAQALVFDVTPWADGGSAAGSTLRPDQIRGDASSWFAFEARGNLAPAKRWTARSLPFEQPLTRPATVAELQRYGHALKETVESYEAACSRLDAVARAVERGEVTGASRRSEANVRLARFWCAMSAFHVRALSQYLVEIERWMPEDNPPKRVVIAWLSAIRMSDCLEAFDGRTISWEQERAYGWVAPETAIGGQGNHLDLPIWDANYRAQRDLDCVLLRLDPRLLPAALRMIDAARDVLRRDDGSAWAWVTYYSDAYTFVWKPGDGELPLGPPDRSQDVVEEDESTPPTTRGGSSGGGSSTR